MRDLVLTGAGMKLRPFCFCSLGLAAAALVLMECPTWRVALGLAIAIWSFCRF